MKLSKIVYIIPFMSKLREITVELPEVYNFHWFLITSFILQILKGRKIFFWLGQVRSGSEGSSHYIIYSFLLTDN